MAIVGAVGGGTREAEDGMKRLVVAAALIAVLAGPRSLDAQPIPPPDDRVADLVHAGKLRIALFRPQYRRDVTSGEISGVGQGIVALQLGRSLAERLGVTMQVVEEPSPQKAAECIEADACDIVFLGLDPARAGELDFTPAISEFDYTYMVPPGSPITKLAEADQPGKHIVTVRGHAAAIALSHTVHAAEIVEAALPEAAFAMLRDGKADAFALPREQLLYFASALPGAKVLNEAYGTNRSGIALRKGQAARLSYFTEFVRTAKATGLVQQIIDENGLRGFRVSATRP